MDLTRRFIGHFKTITRHKRFVRKLCFKCGMYKQGILHDLSKYSPTEFVPGVKYYQGFRSWIDKEKEVNNGISLGWLHHKGRNKHHWEYWQDKDVVHSMPLNYLLESVCDRIAASKNYNLNSYDDSKPYNFLMNGKDRYRMNQQDFIRLEKLLGYLKENGEEKALVYYKSLYKEFKNKGTVNI